MPTLPNWVFLCPYLQDLGGHEAEYVSALIGELKIKGLVVSAALPVQTLVSLPGLAGEHVFKPIRLNKFGDNYYSRLIQKIIRITFKARRGIEYLHVFQQGKPGTYFLLHTAGMEEIELALQAFRIASLGGKVGRLKVIVRADHHDEAARIKQFSRVLSRAGNEVDLYADTVDLAQALQSLTHRNISVVPVPGLSFTQPVGKRRAIKFAYFGLRRNSKGFHLLPELAQCLPLNSEMASFHILVHATAEVDLSENHDQTERQLVSMGVTFDRQRLTSEGYRDRLLDTEVVLLPYDEMIYRYGSSGVFVDALKAGCTVIVPAGTWMAKEAERCSLRRVLVVDYSDPQSVRRGAKQAWESRGRECDRTEEESKWEKQNSPGGVIAALSVNS